MPHSGGSAQRSENQGGRAAAPHKRALGPEGAFTHRIRSVRKDQQPVERLRIKAKPPPEKQSHSSLLSYFLIFLLLHDNMIKRDAFTRIVAGKKAI